MSPVFITTFFMIFEVEGLTFSQAFNFFYKINLESELG